MLLQCLVMLTSLLGLNQWNAPQEDGINRRIIPCLGTRDHFRKAGNRPIIPVPHPVVRLRYSEKGILPPAWLSRLAGKRVILCTGGG